MFSHSRHEQRDSCGSLEGAAKASTASSARPQIGRGGVESPSNVCCPPRKSRFHKTSAFAAFFLLLASALAGDAFAQPPVITITGGPAVTEGMPAQFTISADPAPSSNLSLILSVSEVETSFVSNDGIRTTTIMSGVTSKPYPVPTLDGPGDQPSGPVTVTVNDGQGYTVGTPNSATVTVKDNEPTIVEFSRIGTGAIAEGDYTTIEIALLSGFGANRNLIAGETLTVPLAVTGTGVTTGDYTLACRNNTCLTGVTLLTSPPYSKAEPAVKFTGESRYVSNVFLTLTAVDDSGSEGTETLTVGFGPVTSSLHNLDGGVTATDTEVVDISDNDGIPPRTPPGTSTGPPPDNTDDDDSPDDREALESVYDAAVGMGWTNRDNWKSGEPEFPTAEIEMTF